MGRYRNLKSLDDFRRALRKGYGFGKGKSYKPWLRVQDAKSKGLSVKIQGIKTNRTHHFLSQREADFFQFAEFNDKVIDIRALSKELEAAQNNVCEYRL